MREIIELDGTEYLTHTYKFASAYKKYLVDTGAAAAVAQAPALTGKETPEEKTKIILEQNRKNTEEMVRLLYEDHADLTEKILPMFVVLDKGEKLPSTRRMAAAMSHALNDSDFMDFLLSLM